MAPPRTILVVADQRTVELAASWLRHGAGTNRRAATDFADELEAARAAEPGKDIRPGAMAVTRALGDAGALDKLADALLAAWHGGTEVVAPAGPDAAPPGQPAFPSTLDDSDDAPALPPSLTEPIVPGAGPSAPPVLPS